MKIRKLHSWNVSYDEAVSIQQRLRSKLKFQPLGKKLALVAGADVSFSKEDPRIFAAVVVIKIPEMDLVECKTSVGETNFPYIPGLLAFREIPVLLEIFKKLENGPDAVICDGQGIAHPRGMGLASHLGLMLDIPTVGCAKSRLVGEYQRVPDRRWSYRYLKYKEKTVGAVLRTRKGVKPVFVSPGNRIDLEGSIKIVRQCMTRYRLPEPTRLAHIVVNRFRKETGS